MDKNFDPIDLMLFRNPFSQIDSTDFLFVQGSVTWIKVDHILSLFSAVVMQRTIEEGDAGGIHEDLSFLFKLIFGN